MQRIKIFMANTYSVDLDKTGSTWTPTVRYLPTASSGGTNLAGVRNNPDDLTASLDIQKVLAGVLSVILNDKSARGI